MTNAASSFKSAVQQIAERVHQEMRQQRGTCTLVGTQTHTQPAARRLVAGAFIAGIVASLLVAGAVMHMLGLGAMLPSFDALCAVATLAMRILVTGATLALWFGLVLCFLGLVLDQKGGGAAEVSERMGAGTGAVDTEKESRAADMV
ncbi:hypothetical protein BC830DRAFT_1097105 [Chytriomyces sp. MP71]|nr:hypothetical protein BC830DRAFT_1097105 [Chytriomyces sp. MP71]